MKSTMFLQEEKPMIINEKEYANVIAKNLRRLALEYDKTQNDIASALNVSKSSVSLWFNGKSTPRMDKIDALCKMFNVRRADIMEPKEETIHAALTAEDIRLLSAYHAATEEQKKIVGYILKINEITMSIEE